MASQDVTRMLRALGLVLLVAGVAACSKKEPVPKTEESAVPAPVLVTAAACPKKLQKLMAALPARSEVAGQHESGRECMTSMAVVHYGTGQPLYVRYELNALRYEDADFDSADHDTGQALLDNLRKTMEANIVVLESRLQMAKSAGSDSGVAAMTPEQRAQLPREVTLPNGVKAMVSTTGDGEWALQSVLSDYHMLQISVSDHRKNVSADEAVAELAKLAGEVDYAKL